MKTVGRDIRVTTTSSVVDAASGGDSTVRGGVGRVSRVVLGEVTKVKSILW